VLHKKLRKEKGKKVQFLKMKQKKDIRDYMKCPEREKGKCRKLGGVRCRVFGVYECAPLSCLADKKLVNFSLFEDKKIL
jgi:hypothetical protein